MIKEFEFTKKQVEEFVGYKMNHHWKSIAISTDVDRGEFLKAVGGKEVIEAVEDEEKDVIRVKVKM